MEWSPVPKHCKFWQSNMNFGNITSFFVLNFPTNAGKEATYLHSMTYTTNDSVRPFTLQQVTSFRKII